MPEVWSKKDRQYLKTTKRVPLRGALFCCSADLIELRSAVAVDVDRRADLVECGEVKLGGKDLFGVVRRGKNAAPRIENA